MAKSRPTSPPEFRRQVVELVRAGRSPNAFERAARENKPLDRGVPKVRVEGRSSLLGDSTRSISEAILPDGLTRLLDDHADVTITFTDSKRVKERKR